MMMPRITPHLLDSLSGLLSMGMGGLRCFATYASEVLLPRIATSVAQALKCTIADRGVCTVNGQLRDATALDLDGLICNSD
eukprot:2746038-Ditylum_brightwellii.AAC.1